MESIPRKLRKGGKQINGFIPQVTEDEMWELDTTGFCIFCGNTQEGCEPDARAYECEGCGERGVYGLQELAIRGLLIMSEDEE